MGLIRFYREGRSGLDGRSGRILRTVFPVRREWDGPPRTRSEGPLGGSWDETPGTHMG